ncbi:MAG: hypothetical protein ACE5OW_01770 [Candidatus Bathyarchaeia archaeon]
MKNLEETKKEILDHAKKEGFSIFYGSISVDDAILWNQSQEDWKVFVNIAKNEGVKTLIYDEHILSEDLSELLQLFNEYESKCSDKKDLQLLEEFRSRLKSFEEFSDKTAWVHLGWIKERIAYLLQITSPWYEEFYRIYEKAHTFLKERKEETISLEEKEESLKDTKKRLSLLSTEIVEWAKAQGLRTVTKNQVKVYLLENEIPIGWTEREMLYTIVNKELTKSSPK